MSIVNRSLVPVRGKQPYVDWINTYDPDGSGTTLSEMKEHPSVYLVEPTEALDPERTILPAYQAALFEIELESWWEDRTAWPRYESPEVFHAWFDVEFVEVVIDLCGDPLGYEE